MKTCSNGGCAGGLAVYTVTTVTGRTPLDACKRHLTWAVEFVGAPGAKVIVELLDVGRPR